MKRKLSKKLSLNKKTVVDLNDKTMKNILGGVSESYCYTNCKTCLLSERTMCESLCSQMGPCC